MRVLCARHPHLGLIAALRRYPELREEPVILGGAPELRLPVVAASAAALTAGVRVGQPLRQAQQSCPAAVFVPLDPTGAGKLRAAVCAELHRLSPTVEAGDEESFGDLSGRHAEFPDEASWAAAGMLAPTTEGRWGEGTLQALSQASAAAWPGYAAALEEDSGLPVGLRRDGTLSVALDADDYRALEESFAVQRELGIPVKLVGRMMRPARESPLASNAGLGGGCSAPVRRPPSVPPVTSV